MWDIFEWLFSTPGQQKCDKLSMGAIRGSARDLCDAIDDAYAQAWDTGDVRGMDELRAIAKIAAARMWVIGESFGSDSDRANSDRSPPPTAP